MGRERDAVKSIHCRFKSIKYGLIAGGDFSRLANKLKCIEEKYVFYHSVSCDLC